MPSRNIPAEFSKNWQLRIGGVPCNIYDGPNPENPGAGITESNGPDGRHATVNFLCYWEDRLDLVAGLVGTVDYVGGSIVRQDPFAYPMAARDVASGKAFPDRTVCTAITSIQGVKPWTPQDDTNVGLAGWQGFAYAIVQAEFTTPPYLIVDLLGPGVPPESPAFNDLSYQTYCISRVRVSGEVFSPPTGAFVFAGGAFNGQALLDVGASQIRTRFEVSITRVRMPLVPMTVATTLTGTVNDAQFLVGGQLFPKGAMLFTGINPEPRSDPYNGGIIWDVELTFMANGQAAGQDTPLDWNYFLDPGGAWSQVTTAGGDPVFAYADHTQLYQNAIS
jgi:hypothetical protein